jgi:hypothetical protein
MVNTFVSARCARKAISTRESYLVNIGDATFCVSDHDSSGSNAMHSTSCNSIGCQRALVRAGLRTPVSLARLWTGRARVSTATNTTIPRCVTTTAHRTRVSEKRPLPSRSTREPLKVAVGPETSTSQRRGPRKPRYLSG